MSNAELASLLLIARSKNAQLGVGGILVHQGGSFIQALEGESGVVESLFARIERDERHHRVLVLARESLAQREFGDWSMGFVDGVSEAASALPGFNDFFRRGFDLTQLASSATRARGLLSAFRDGRFRRFVNER